MIVMGYMILINRCLICYNENIDVNQRGEEPIAKAVGDGYTRIFKQNPNLWNILHDCIF